MLKTRRLILISTFVVACAFFVWFFIIRDPGDPLLKPFVQSSPPYPVVFTSRTEPVSFRAASVKTDYTANSQAIVQPGLGEWQAREGRLRVLMPSGAVRELTWQKPLPDGGSLIDVMSPTVSSDGNTIFFSGRRPDKHGGRFRLYRVQLDGSNLKPVFEKDPGCPKLPPMRFDARGQTVSDSDRCQMDYDDIDPMEAPPNAIVFASSRMPDAGGHDRRATQLWVKPNQGEPYMLTASRSNDRWPFITIDRSIIFSLWSRVDDVVADDGAGLARYNPVRPGLTSPVNGWLGASILPTGEAFSHTVKLPEPVWRPRPTPAGKITFMTPAEQGSFTTIEKPEYSVLRIAQAEHGRVGWAPSSLALESQFPQQHDKNLTLFPMKTADGKIWSLATPSPMPATQLIVSASSVGDNGIPEPHNYGLYLIDQKAGDDNILKMTALFDDPHFVDAEPVAAYHRGVPESIMRTPDAESVKKAHSVKLFNGNYLGPTGKIDSKQLTDIASAGFPGQKTDRNDGPVIPTFPNGSLKRIDFYASHRDRFDDSEKLIIRGTLEKILEIPVQKQSPTGNIEFDMPIGSPTLLVGIGVDGKVVKTTGAADNSGRRGIFYAYAGDHVSGMKPGGYTFCTGCHTGHTFVPNTPIELAK